MNMGQVNTDSEIDLTNLLDLMVILTAALMLTISPISALSTRLPEVNSNKSGLNPQSTILISFSKSESLRWNNEPITWSELEKKVQKYSHKTDCPEVLLAGDSDASYGLSVRLRALLGKFGLKVKELARCQRSE